MSLELIPPRVRRVPRRIQKAPILHVRNLVLVQPEPLADRHLVSGLLVLRIRLPALSPAVLPPQTIDLLLRAPHAEPSRRHPHHLRQVHRVHHEPARVRLGIRAPAKPRWCHARHEPRSAVAQMGGELLGRGGRRGARTRHPTVGPSLPLLLLTRDPRRLLCRQPKLPGRLLQLPALVIR